MTTTLDQLKAAVDAMVDPRDLPRTLTERQTDEHITRRHALNSRYTVGRRARAVIDDTAPRIARLKKSVADLEAIREELAQELLAIPPRPRDAQLARQELLKISILGLDGRFDLDREMLPPGPLPLFVALEKRGYRGTVDRWWNPLAGVGGSLPTLNYQLKELQQQHDDAVRMLDMVLRDPIPATVQT